VFNTTHLHAEKKHTDCTLGMVKEDRVRTSYVIQFRRLPYVDLMIYSHALLSTDTCLEKKLNLLCYIKLQILLTIFFHFASRRGMGHAQSSTIRQYPLSVSFT
jgi:hypothetical protein